MGIDYYPFGLSFNSYVSAANSKENKYLYNGKEAQSETGWYDYWLRQYDPELGRWHAIDPSAERYYRWSPYTYVFNSPIMYIDPDGADPGMSYEEKIEDGKNTPADKINGGAKDKEQRKALTPMGELNMKIAEGAEVLMSMLENMIEVDKAAPTETADSEIEDGIEVTTDDGKGVDNAPNGTGAIVEKGKSAVGFESPDESSRTQQVLGNIVEYLIEKTTPKRTGDSTIVKDVFNNGKGMVVPLLDNGNPSYTQSSGRYRTATESDSSKFLDR